MQKAVIKECTNKSTYYQIALIIGKKPMWYDIEISSDDFKLLKSSKECEFETNGKALTKLFVGGKEIALNRIDQAKLSMPNKASKQNSENYSRKRNSNKNRIDNNISPNKQAFKEYAKAPYNFVPINETVIPAETIPEFDYYHKDRYTGYIDLDIEALTPLYIRDTYTKEEEVLANQAKEACKICKDKDCDKCDHAKHRVNPDFFAPGGIPKIPGSSLRGMVRNLVEIVSYSKMEFTEKDKRFYYRKVATPGRYQKLMIKRDGGVLCPASEAGWLKKEYGKYYIYPLQKQQIYRIHAPLKDSKWVLTMNSNKGQGEKLDQFKFYPISFIPAKEEVHNHRGGTIKLRYALIKESSFELGHQKAESDERYEKGYLILSGKMGSNKHLHPVIHCPQNEGKIEIDQDLINSYEGDSSREPEANLLKMLKKDPDGVPCLYLKDSEGNIKSIGHTPMFRLVYDKKVKDHIPNSNSEFKGTDIATAIFGNANEFAGRVFFEDAKIINNAGQYPALAPRVLSTPKPTTVQHYLKQEGEKIADWDDDTYIRGYKLYWHRRTPQKALNQIYQWEATDKEKKKAKSQLTLIRPFHEGTVFSGRIRFENLSEVELGALLFVLDLPPECAHKIGMGKPLGLGSICISPTVVISNRTGERASHTGRYGKLFDNQQWYLPIEEVSKDFKAEFSRYIWSALPDEEKAGANSVNDLWSISRIKELWVILRYDNESMENNKWLEKTRYMEIEREGVPREERNEFRKQPILQSPSEILN
jgi:CRISPR-associated protein (TIGR03986 family)